MDVTIDTGNNATELINQLAEQLHMTVKEILPYYIEATQIQAISGLAIFAVAMVVVGVVSHKLLSVVRILRSEDSRDDGEFIALLIGACIVASFAVVLFTGIINNAPRLIAQYKAPQAYAIGSFATDARKLLH